MIDVQNPIPFRHFLQKAMKDQIKKYIGKKVQIRGVIATVINIEFIGDTNKFLVDTTPVPVNRTEIYSRATFAPSEIKLLSDSEPFGKEKGGRAEAKDVKTSNVPLNYFIQGLQHNTYTHQASNNSCKTKGSIVEALI